MTGNTNLKYALFPNLDAARAAQVEVDAAIDGEVDLLENAADLAQDKLPLRHTMAGFGTIVGASVVAGLMLAAVAGVVMLGFDALPPSIPAPYWTLAIVVVLASLLGGLAGALSYSTRARDELRRLRTLLRFGNSVLLIETEQNLDALLRRRGAVQTGTLA
ncbi:hypothetical protein DB30_06631 [Enhygromyxa salina]|uniref:Uncharacterized protein n=1 Tax=Enhygromyxa salina TaxID=215803 RepID=A0A0C2CTU3_9BACT|nr:hypothetical protein [Enhygromyxa salina]KIG14576.1 hypothetical protein DB30_06631 [Enhygromyxa salina]